MPQLRNLKLAHSVLLEKRFTILLLIRTDHYWSFIQDNIIRGKGPTTQMSELCYLLSGPLPTMVSEAISSALLQIISVITNEPNEADIEHFWSIEAVGTETSTSSPDMAFLQRYQQSFISETSYVAKFPWRENKPYLLFNFTVWIRKTFALVSKFKKTPELLKAYKKIIT